MGVEKRWEWRDGGSGEMVGVDRWCEWRKGWNGVRHSGYGLLIMRTTCEALGGTYCDHV